MKPHFKIQMFTRDLRMDEIETNNPDVIASLPSSINEEIQIMATIKSAEDAIGLVKFLKNRLFIKP